MADNERRKANDEQAAARRRARDAARDAARARAGNLLSRNISYFLFPKNNNINIILNIIV